MIISYNTTQNQWANGRVDSVCSAFKGSFCFLRLRTPKYYNLRGITSKKFRDVKGIWLFFRLWTFCGYQSSVADDDCIYGLIMAGNRYLVRRGNYLFLERNGNCGIWSAYRPRKDNSGGNKKKEKFNLPRNGLWLARGEPAISLL